jgi:poly(3-hydroxybutyrate) depolymerase
VDAVFFPRIGTGVIVCFSGRTKSSPYPDWPISQWMRFIGGQEAKLCAVGTVLLVLSLLSGGCQSGASVAHSTEKFRAGTGFTYHQIVVDGTTRNCWIFLPKDYRPTRKYPTILFLHGLFEAGEEADKCLAAGLGPVIAQHPDNWPFITIFPQSDGNWKGEAHERIALAAMDYTQSHYSVDRDRVILAGLSYGALGTWEIGAKHSERFAALVPVSGHRATELVERLIMVPVWAFAYTGDMWVKSDSSEEMCREISERGGKAKLTEFEGVGHDGWSRAVAESNVVEWMLQQRRSNVAPTPVAAAGRTTVAHIE